MRRTLEVVGQGAATQPPDRLDLYLTVSLVRADVGTALRSLAAQVTALGATLRATGLGDADLRTTSSSLGEEYGGSDPTGRPISAGFRASQEVLVRLRDTDSAADVLAANVLAAAVASVGDDLRLSHLAWSVSDEAPLVDLAREAAFADAQEKATKLAALAGAELGPLLRVIEGAGTGGSGAGARELASKADSAFAAERGENRVEVSLSTRWALC